MKLKQIRAFLLSAALITAPITSNACTSFTLTGADGGYVYGRSLEFGVPLKSALVVIPRGYNIQGVGTPPRQNSCRVIMMLNLGATRGRDVTFWRSI